MARAKSKAAKKSATRAAPRSAARTASRAAPQASRTAKRGTRRSEPSKNAIALLKADHRQVEEWFAQYEKTRATDRKRAIAWKICTALRVHTQIEEEIFYPAFYEATREEDLHHEAIIEHDGAKKLIAEIESTSPDDDFYDARVKVLSEMIKHHVMEEEQRDGMFAKARDSEMDLTTLGVQLAERKAELESSPEAMKALTRVVDAGKGFITRLTATI